MQFYLVENFKGFQPMLVHPDTQFEQMYTFIIHSKQYADFQIYHAWQPISLTENRNLRLREFIQRSQSKQYVFYICEIVNEQINEQQQKYYQQLKQHFKEVQPKEFQKGSNGNILFQGRKLALLASSIKHATHHSDYIHQMGPQVHNNIKSSFIADNNSSSIQPVIKPNFLKSLFIKMGLIKKPNFSNLQSVLKVLKDQSQVNKETLKIDTQYSNYDPKFIAYLESIYLKFMVKSGFKLHYNDYSSMQFGIIKEKLKKNCKIGIIGDYGTGLQDAVQLLQNLVMKDGVNVILHLGDVYYAGTPQEYQNSIMKPLKEIRLKCHREILFYSIPGNHDYYSWGMPYLCFLKSVNQSTFTKQQASYFCLRDESNLWQFLGADTAYYDSNPINQIQPTNTGPHIRYRELAWHKDKINNFQGSTILLTHHQLMSIHDRICGSLSKYRTFSCINPLLSSQLFQFSSYISCWFWGHQHAFMLYKNQILGIPKCRLLGNSSFHVIFSKETPYKRKQGFPIIPFITDDETYHKKYLPLSPQRNDKQYFNLCYAVIDMAKISPNEDMKIQYYCTPCYSQEEKKIRHFNTYLIYEETILCKSNLMKLMKGIKDKQRLYLKSQIGLMVSYNEVGPKLDLSGKQLTIHKKMQIKQQLEDHDQVYIQASEVQSQLYLTNVKGQIKLIPKHETCSVWTILKVQVMKSENKAIRTKDAFELRNEGQELNWQTDLERSLLKIKKHKCLWMFLENSQIKI